jgi:putative Mg2+ transporter-C (MgtC) family protein
MTVEAEVAALSMTAAIVCGAIIGMERQARQRMAGVRTNALVALGASSFVIFSQLFPGEPSQTRVAAQIVSGIGFIGAGLIFRDGFRLHGLNTAATLWCSAGVGMMCGAGAVHLAAILTAMVLVLNLFLRPVVNFLDARVFSGLQSERTVRLRLVCRSDREEDLRALTLRMLIQAGFRLVEMDSHPSEDGAGVEVVLILSGHEHIHEGLEKAVALLAVEPGVSHVDGQAVEE